MAAKIRLLIAKLIFSYEAIKLTQSKGMSHARPITICMCLLRNVGLGMSNPTPATKNIYEYESLIAMMVL